MLANAGKAILLLQPAIVAIAFLVCCANAGNPYDNAGKEEQYKELDAWEPPAEFKKDFPYSLIGHDFEGRPVWNLPFWKWAFHKLGSANETVKKDYDKYVQQLSFRLYNSPKYVPKQNSEEDLVVDGWVLFINMDGFDLTQLVRYQTLEILFKMLAIFDVAAETMDYGFVVNTNYFAEIFTNTLKPIIGRTLAKMSIRGTLKEKWLPEVYQAIPKASLPLEFGGFKNHTNLANFG